MLLPYKPCSYCVSHSECEKCGNVVPNEKVNDDLICEDCQTDGQELLKQLIELYMQAFIKTYRKYHVHK